MDTPINFFKSLFKIRKETLDGTEPISLAYLNPNTGAMNTGLYCTTQAIANLAQTYSPPSTPKIYKAIITQTGTNNPVATVLNSGDNNFLTGVTLSRHTTGDYYINKIGITDSNTFVHFNSFQNSGNPSISDTFCMADKIVIGLRDCITGSAFDGIYLGYLTIEYYGS